MENDWMSTVTAQQVIVTSPDATADLTRTQRLLSYCLRPITQVHTFIYRARDGEATAAWRP